MMDNKVINTARILSAEAIQKANSGHPGLPLGAAPMAYTLWSRESKHSPSNPEWDNRDRFILSAGHGSMLQYSLLHLFGYDLPMSEIENFRQWESKTPGHPEFGHTKGVEISTGPLGQGFASAVGFAMAEARLADKFNTAKFNDVVDHFTYVIVGDGCLMEGISYEAASLAGTLKLGKLITLYDSNSISIEGNTNLAFTENVKGRFEAMDWQVLEVADGNDVDAIQAAIQAAKKETVKPSIIIVTTEIGYGAPGKQGTSGVHGSPLGDETIKEMKAFLGMEDKGAFVVEDDVRSYMSEMKSKLDENAKAWEAMMAEYRKEEPELAKEYDVWYGEGDYASYLESDEFWSYNEATASRGSSGKVLNNIEKYVPNLMGGSADLAPSNKSDMKARDYFSADNHEGSNLHFGVRELGMSAIVNGIQAHGGLKAYAATFFVFSDYMKPSMRLAAMMKLPVTYILTHDSIGVGEDGPTHQPIDQLAMLRAVPNLNVFRPADAREVSAGWYTAMMSKETPTALVLTRQNLPAYDNSSREALKGGYVLAKEDNKADIVIMASGSEVEFAMGAKEMLKAEGVDARVVSMPCMDIFNNQSKDYQASVIPKGVPALAVEAGTSLGWYKFADEVISRDDFGASAPAKKLFEEYGFTSENVAKVAKSML